MLVTKYILIGNVTVPSSWVAIMLAFLIAYSAIRLKYGKKFSLLFADLIFYFIIVWKLSVIITDFKTVIQFPLSFIYFNGGTVGVFLGLIAASIKLISEVRKGQFSNEGIAPLLIGMIMIQSVYQLMMVLFNDGLLVIQLVTFITFSLLLIFSWFFMEKFQDLQLQFILLFMAVHLFIGTIQQGGLFQASVLATVYTGIFFIGILFLLRKKK